MIMNKHTSELFRLFELMPSNLAAQAAPKVWDMVFTMLTGPCKILNAGAGHGGLSWVLDKAGIA